MATNTLSTEKKFTWGGGKSPFSVSYGKLMMWIFLLSDAFTFSSLLIAYGFIRYSFQSPIVNTLIKPFDHLSHEFVQEMVEKTKYFVQDHWPSPELVFNHFPFIHGVHLPLFFVSLMTFILIFSSVTMVLAVEAGHRMAKDEVSKYMLLTIIGGAAFLGCQAWEWTTFIGEGARLYGNPYGPRSFAALFFIVTGFHGFHVFSGVVLNVIIYINVLAGTYQKRGHYEMVEKVGLYWHFVDLVWVFVFTFFYLI
ncbi:MAG: cytochrome c oxidase subunit 3 [Bacteroidia bacterium]|nr:cytochrome c oxidase subunit 3 [Bacteroidia bacterium]MCF8445503.1 cytochrome c oxidase subunit 3 [Bacteroidia bacterium]